MSCWIVSTNHINAIVNFTRTNRKVIYLKNKRKLDMSNVDDCQEMGQILLDENCNSYNYRYDEKEFQEYEFKITTEIFNPVRMLKQLNCLNYQSCEHPDYEDSLALFIIDQVKDMAIPLLPQYDSYEWGID